MIVGPIPSSTLQSPPDAGRPTRDGGLRHYAAADQASFDTLMAAAAATATIPAAFMSQELARADTPLEQDRAGARASRLSTLRQSDADSRAAGGSRISGADRSTLEPPETRNATSTDERGTHDVPRPNHRAKDASSRDPRIAAPAGPTTPKQTASNTPTSASTEPHGPAQSIRTTEPSPRAAGQSRDTDRSAPPPSGSGPSVHVATEVDRSPTDAVPKQAPADGVAKTATLRGATSAEVRQGSQSASDTALQARPKEARPNPPRPAGQSQPRSPEHTARASAFERISQAIRAMKNGNDWVARVRLDPPSLGHVRVSIRASGDVVHVRLSAETADAQRTLASQVSELRAALEEQGLRLERIEITGPPRDDSTPDHPTRYDTPHTPQPHGGTGDGGTRHENRQADDHENQRLATNRDEPELIYDGNESALTADGWLDVRA